MGRARLALFLLLLATGRATAAVDSLTSLPTWLPRDIESGIRLTPHAVAVDPLGRLWILDRTRGRIMRPAADGAGYSWNFGGLQGSAAAPVSDLAISGAFLFLLEPTSPSITLLDLDGAFRERVDLAESLETSGKPGFLASRLLVGSSGDLWLFEPRSGGLLRFDRRGRYLDAPLEAMAGAARTARIADLALAPKDGVVLLDTARGGLLPLQQSGASLEFEPLTPAPVEPASLAVDGQGRRYVLEAGGRLRILEEGGALLLDRVVPEMKSFGQVRLAITGDGVLCAADPAKGRVLRWRVASSGREDEK
jgi:hypothetical protein